MPEPLSLWECPHGHRALTVDTSDGGLRCAVTTCGAPIASMKLLFFEEDVRPLWEALGVAQKHLRYSVPELSNERHDAEVDAVVRARIAFSAPESWKAKQDA